MDFQLAMRSLEEVAYERGRNELRAENDRLRAVLKPFADELDCLEANGCKPPPERMLMFASDGGGTFMGLSVGAFYDARVALLNAGGIDAAKPVERAAPTCASCGAPLSRDCGRCGRLWES